MSRVVHEFDPPDRFIADAVGPPGERAFYLQASGRGRVVSVSLEKVQVAVLAERLGQLLDEVRRRLGSDSGVPEEPIPELADHAPLDAPLDPEFHVGTMAIAWDAEARRVVVEAQAVGVDEADEPSEPLLDDDADGPELLRVRIDPSTARGFVVRALRVVAAGRPPCPLCGLPLDPDGHVCPRLNGHAH